MTNAADDVVLTGLSGRFPESDSVEEFAQQLFAGDDLVTADDRRWTPGLYGLPARGGKLKDLTQFDAEFFGVLGTQAHMMDPQLRVLLEVTHEALVDAGVSPGELRGSRTGVYVGVCNSESEVQWNADPNTVSSYGIIGCCRSMFPNRVSYSFDFKGPSQVIDSACSSSTSALAHAVAAIRAGDCDAAVVAGCNLCLNPSYALNFQRLDVLSPNGRCAAFDASCDGYVRSEAVVAVLLQRRGVARRVYATVRGARCNTDGNKVQGLTYPSGDMQGRLATETFAKAGLRPQDVAYVEAHGTGTKVGDPEELNAIAEVFCAGRATPLLVGSVKSNMGHSEPASGLCSVAKVLLAMERGVIPGNLHYRTPHPDIPALSDGRIKVVDRNTAWGGGLVAINSFGFGGTNAHVILESHCGPRPPPARYAVPRLVLASGRSEAAVRALLEHAHAHAADAELHALLDAVHAQNIAGHPRRGYRLLVDPPIQEILEYEECSEPLPIWFVFSGMGSQWAGAARALLALAPFAASVARSAAALRVHDFDLHHLLTEAPEAAFDDVLNAFVSITAVQVALVDVLRELGVRPDGVLGHSVGEVACAYAVDALTGEQAVLCAYWRGRCVRDAAVPPGAMAAVGLSWEQCVARCPPGVSLACHNAADSVTVSGAAEAVQRLVAELSAEGVFARSVRSAGLALHSAGVARVAPLLRRRLQDLIPSPRPRTRRWVSTSLPEDQWDSENARLCDAEYFVNNMVSPVLFCAALRAVPARAALIELAPHALLAGVLRRELPRAVHVPLVRRAQGDACEQLLRAVGKLYCAGAAPTAARLYPAMPWPVSRGTPALAAHVRWARAGGCAWRVARCARAAPRAGGRRVQVDLAGNDAYLCGHEIDGRIFFPFSGYLTLVWRTLAELHHRRPEETAVLLEDVRAEPAALLLAHGCHTCLVVHVFHGSGAFEVCEGDRVLASGTARLADPAAEHDQPEPEPEPTDEEPPLDADDVYKELRLRGYNYSGEFCGVRAARARGAAGALAWRGGWTAFIDTLLQLWYVGEVSREPLLPVQLQRALLDPRAQGPRGGVLPARVRRDVRSLAAGGVQLRGLHVRAVPRRPPARAPTVERHVFVPFDAQHARCGDALAAALQLALENAGALALTVAEAALGRAPAALLLPDVLRALGAQPQVRVHASLAAGRAAADHAALAALGVQVTSGDEVRGECHLVLCGDVLARGREDALAGLACALRPAGALLLREPRGALAAAGGALLRRVGLALAARHAAPAGEYLLLRRAATLPAQRVTIDVAGAARDWLPALRRALERTDDEDLRVYLVSRERDSGVLGLGTCLRGEVGGHALRVFHAPGACAFSPTEEPYATQLQHDLAVNVLRDGAWGSYLHLPLDVGAEEPVSFSTPTSKRACATPDLTPAQVAHAHATVLVRGDVGSLRWLQSAPPGTTWCRVHYAALNPRDVLLATGARAARAHAGLGLEFSGRDARGERVMGAVAGHALASDVCVEGGLLWRVPESWTLEQAATVPAAYALAYYALAVVGRARRGDAVLVLAGGSGAGLAAVAVALHAGCEVFTATDKRALLLTRFPALPEQNVGALDGFERLVQKRTQGRGVQLVLSALPACARRASARCVARGGRFLQLGDVDRCDEAPLDTNMFPSGASFHRVSLEAMLVAGVEAAAEREAVALLVEEGIAGGAVQPLPAVICPADQLAQGFRDVASGRHAGKVLVEVRGDSGERSLRALPRTYMHPAKSYVLVGGLGGFGLELAQWLVERGATRLVLNSRGGVRSGYQAWCIRRWRLRGVRVQVSNADASSAAGARALLLAARALGAVGGVFQLAAVLRDAFLENLTPEDFDAVAKPKFDCTLALDEASRELAPELEHFVAWSSVSSGRCNPGQSNYALANSAMERVVERRRREGLPGLAIQWGAIGDIGLTMEMLGAHAVVAGTAPQPIASCLDTLDVLLARAPPDAVVSCHVLADKTCAPAAARRSLLHQVAEILGIKEPGEVSQETSLSKLGVDSLMAAEIKVMLERDHELVLNVYEIRELCFARLSVLADAETVLLEQNARNDEEKSN